MPISAAQLTTIGTRLVVSMNARDYGAASSLYAEDATYESPRLVSDGHVDSRIVGRQNIMSYFKEALEGDDDFQLAKLDQFTGLNMAVILSSLDGQTFIDVLRVGDDGLIIQHSEVAPKNSPIDFLQLRPINQA
jgi:hypothetical protein